MTIFKTMAAGLGALLLSVQPTCAETLSEALVKAYSYNPTLQAARHDYESVLYMVPEAQSGYRPTVNAFASQTWSRDENSVNGNIPGFFEETNLSTQQYGVEVVQALFKGGRTSSAVASAKAFVEARSYALQQSEQDVFLDVVESYLGLRERLAIERLREKNVLVLEEQRQATQDRFDVGTITKTDVSQADARLSQARAALIQAKGETNKARAKYEKTVGIPETYLLEKDFVSIDTIILPKTIGVVIEEAENDHPQIAQARALKNVALHDVDNVFGELLPQLNAVGSVAKTHDPSANIKENDNAQISLDLSIPLYQGGATRARMQSQQKTLLQREDEINEAKRTVRLEAISAWNDFVSNESQIEALKKQVESADVALKGVMAESQVGARTVLDILDAEEELLDARVSLVSAETAYEISKFTLLAVLGDLTLQGLELDGISYDREGKYEEVDGNWMFFE